ncbi:MAG: hypothetical protein ACO3YZ_08115, partial [Candidatus Nanopelagicaceae bacterium]
MKLLSNTGRNSQRILLTLTMFCVGLTILACGGGDSSENTSSSSTEAASSSASTTNTAFQRADALGVWNFGVFLQEDTCDRDLEDSRNFNVTLYSGGACFNSGPTGPNPVFTEDGFVIETIEDVLDCGGGVEAAFVRTVSCLEIANNTGVGTY